MSGSLQHRARPLHAPTQDHSSVPAPEALNSTQVVSSGPSPETLAVVQPTMNACLSPEPIQTDPRILVPDVRVVTCIKKFH
jgi:hypothetical protein